MASSTALFTGVGVALVTLFDDEGEIDAPATADHAGRLVEAGVEAVVVAGTTGEAAALDADERSDLLMAVRYVVDGRIPVLAGTGAASARQAVYLSKRAADDGADGLLVLSPGNTADPRPYYERVAAAVDVPVLAYHFPKVSSPGVPVDVLRQLPVAGIKDSSGEAERLIVEADELARGCTPAARRSPTWPAPSAAPERSSPWPTSIPRGACGRGRATASCSAPSSPATGARPWPASPPSSAPSAPSTAPPP